MTDNHAEATSPATKWIEDAHNGDDAAVGRLLEGYRQYLLLVANQELRDDLRPKAAASDLVQETFLRAHREFGRFHGQSTDELRAWLRCILMNHLANVDRDFRGTAKRNLGREVAGEKLFAEGLDGGLASPADSPSREMVVRERDEELHRALAQLPEEYRLAIIWRNYDVLPFEFQVFGPHSSTSAGAST